MQEWINKVSIRSCNADYVNRIYESNIIIIMANDVSINLKRLLYFNDYLELSFHKMNGQLDVNDYSL